MMTFTGLDKVPNMMGFLVINEDGGVIASGGDLENDEHVAGVIVSMLQAAGKWNLVSGEKTEPLQRLSVTYDDHMYVVCVSNKKIHVVKRRYVPPDPVIV